MTRSHAENRLEEKKEERERWITVAIAIGFIALIPSLVLAVFLWREIDQRSAQSRALIAEVQQHEEEVERDRVAVRKAIRQADIENCQEDEIVKARLRGIVAFDPEEVALTLEQLGIDPSSERGRLLAERSKQQADEAVRALAPRDCTKLPDPTDPNQNQGSG
jgi:hypothetical protein